MIKPLLALTLCLIFPAITQAGNITLNAKDRVEYHQKEQKLVAKGNAVATKENMSIRADTLIGFYNPKTKNKISRVEAHNNVVMKTPQAQAFGNNMVYDVNKDSAVLKGNPAKVTTSNTTITAKGSITYYQSEQKAVAIDDVIVIDTQGNQGNQVHADLMIAYFTKDKSGKMILKNIDIEKNVKITSRDAVVTALKGKYNALEGKVYLFDDIVITQQGNVLKGSKAETDLKTGISKILSGSTSGRVSGVFKEKSKKETK